MEINWKCASSPKHKKSYLNLIILDRLINFVRFFRFVSSMFQNVLIFSFLILCTCRFLRIFYGVNLSLSSSYVIGKPKTMRHGWKTIFLLLCLSTSIYTKKKIVSVRFLDSFFAAVSLKFYVGCVRRSLITLPFSLSFVQVSF